MLLFYTGLFQEDEFAGHRHHEKTRPRQNEYDENGLYRFVEEGNILPSNSCDLQETHHYPKQFLLSDMSPCSNLPLGVVLDREP